MFTVTSSLLLNDKIFVVAIGSNSLTDNRRPSLLSIDQPTRIEMDEFKSCKLRADPERGGQGSGSPPPEKSQGYRFSL